MQQDLLRETGSEQPESRLRLKLSSLRTTTTDQLPPSTTAIKTTTGRRNRTPSLTEIQEHLIRANMLNLNPPKQHSIPELVVSSSVQPPPTHQNDHSTPTSTLQTNNQAEQTSNPPQQTTDPTPQTDIPAQQSTDNSTPQANNPTPTPQANNPAKQPKEHPLQHSWTLYFDTRAPKRSSSGIAGSGLQAYEAGLQTIGTFKSVEQFSRYFNWTVTPSKMEMNSSVQLFKSHIKPMWEDPANSNGGKWTLTIKSNSNLSLLDRLWTYLALGLVGEQINPSGDDDSDDDFICGAMVATRLRGNRIQIWVKEKDNIEKINSFGKKLRHVLELDDQAGITVEFSAHQNTSSSSNRAGGGNNSTPSRPTLGGGVMGMPEKMMGGAAGPLMRRSTSAEVGQIGSGRMNSTIGQMGLNDKNNFQTAGPGGSGIYRGGLTGPTGSIGRSQLSSFDPPIQNGVWRPSPGHLPAPPAESMIRPAGLTSHQPPSLLNHFGAGNRRPQSTNNITTIGSLGSSGQLGHSGSNLKPTISHSPFGSLPPGLHDPHHQAGSHPLSKNPSGQRGSDGASSQAASRNPSPAPTSNNHLGTGILSGS